MRRKKLLEGAFPAVAIAVLAGLVGASPAGAAGDAVEYSVVQRFALGGAGKWDYTAIDDRGQRLFVTRGDHVEVLDAQSGKSLGVITGTDGVHGVALDPARGVGFTSNGKSDTVTEFALDTLAVRRQIPVGGKKPDAILLDTAGKRLITMNGASSDLSVLDPETGAIVRRIALPGRPEYAVLQGAHLFVNLEDTGFLVKVDLDAGKVLQAWKLPDCEEPTGLALDAQRGRLFSVCANARLVVTDAGSGRNVASLPIGEGADAVIYDAGRQRIYSSNGKSATLTIVVQRDADHYSVVQTLATALGARTMALDAASGRIYLPTPNGGDFAVLVVAPVR